MEHLIKKAAYLKGLAEGLDISPKSDEGKLFIKMIELIGDLTDEIVQLKHDNLDLLTRLEMIEDDMDDFEAELYGEDDDDDYEFSPDSDEFDSDSDEDYDDMDYFEIECPNCKEDVLIDYDMIDDKKGIVCPNCNQEIELEFECDDDCDDDCDCGCHD